VDKGLFTTLSTTTRMIEFSGRKFLLTDTVGFIDRLPLTLIEAFHSTLEETIYTDVIILVLDMNEPEETIQKKYTVCLETIERIGASGIPIITTLNKIDLLSEQEAKTKLETLKQRINNPILISALRRTNLDLLKNEILKKFETQTQASFSIPITNEAITLISWLHNKTNVKKQTYTNNTIEVTFESDPTFAENIRKKVEKLNGTFKTNHNNQK
jgi:GTP-binding protein HflX